MLKYSIPSYQPSYAKKINDLMMTTNSWCLLKQCVHELDISIEVGRIRY